MDQGKVNDERALNAEVEKILAEDQEFQKDIADIGEALSGAEVSDLSAEDAALNFDEDVKVDEPQLKEDAPTLVRKFHLKVVVPLRAFKARSIERFWSAYEKIKETLQNFVSSTKIFFKQSLPDFFRYLMTQLVAVYALLQTQWIRFWLLSRSKKIAIVSVFLLSVGALSFVMLSFKSGWLSRYFHTLPTSYKNVGYKIGEVSSRSAAIPFSVAFPDAEYQVKLRKVVVNLRPDSNSGSLPMGAFDFYLGLDSQDTAIEIKDREDEVLDRVQRALESMSYTEIMTDTGKLKMKARIRDSINQMLNQGRVVGVYINTMVTNH